MKTSRDDLIGWSLVGAGLVALILLVPGLAATWVPAPMRVLLGWGAFIVIPAIILGGVMLAFAGRLGWEVRWRAIVFGEVLILAILGLLHLSLAQPLDAGWTGAGPGAEASPGTSNISATSPAPTRPQPIRSFREVFMLSDELVGLSQS
jgi:hypothetical protein